MSKEKVLSNITGTLQLLVGLGAVVMGIMLMMEPNGEGIGLPLELLKNSPFADYLIPGLILFSINGIASLIGAFLSFRNNRFAGFAAMVLGIAMVIWITAQVVWFGSQSALQPLFLVVGLVELALGFLLTDRNIGKGMFQRHHPPHAH